MKRSVAMGRFRCAGSAATTCRRVLAILAVWIAIPAGWKLLLEDYEYVSRPNAPLAAARGEQSETGFDESSGAEHSQEVGWPRSSSGQLANPHGSEAQNESANPRIAIERFNAALAAGLIDPPKIDLVEPLAEALTPDRRPVISLTGPVSDVQNRAGGIDRGARLVAVAVPRPPACSGSNATKSSDAAAFSVAQLTDEVVTVPSTQSDHR
ncbi:MAG: hypothetical protein JO066_09615 [Verrucomicrobia bacterium]|nr:hypothetical protein [Verrucomicrobiota bacterium]